MRWYAWLTLIILVCISIVVLFERQIDREIYTIDRVAFDDISFRTGDVILARHDYFYDFDILRYISLGVGSKVLTGSVYTHACLVVVIDGISYVYHTHLHPGYDSYSSMYKYKYVGLERLDEYVYGTNSEFIHYQYTGRSIDSDVMAIIQEYDRRNITYTINPINFVNVVSPGPFKFGDEYICTHLLAEILQQVDIFDTTLPSHKYNPMTIYNDMCASPDFLTERPRLIKNIQYALRRYGSLQVDPLYLNSID